MPENTTKLELVAAQSQGEAPQPVPTGRNPFLSDALRPIRRELEVEDLPVEGRLPANLSGTYLRNGPSPAVAPGPHYHMLDGDGMVHGVWLGGGKATRYRNRWVRTEGFQREQRAGRALYSGVGDPDLPRRMMATLARQPGKLLKLGSALANPEWLMQRIFDLVPIKNAANTSVIRHGGRLLALWECGPPHELSDTLDTLGIAEFAGGQPAPFFSAHPKIDPVSGELHTFGQQYFPRPAFHYYAYDLNGKLTHNCRIPLRYRAMMHDFALTRDYLVLISSPLLITMDAPWAQTKEGFAWRPDLGSEIVIVDRRALARVPPGGDGSSAVVHRLTADAAFVLHLGNAFTRGDDLVVHTCAYACPPMRLGQATRESVSPHQPSRAVRMTISLSSGSIRREVMDDANLEFPLFNEHFRGFETSVSYFSASSSAQPNGAHVFDSIVRFDERSATRQQFVFEGQQMFEAMHAVDPNDPAESGGWILCTSWELDSERSWLNVLSARDVERGPIARVQLPQRLPMGVHGTWAPNHNCRPGCPVCGA